MSCDAMLSVCPMTFHSPLVLEFKFVGAAFAPHKIYKRVCVLTFATAVKDKASILREDCSVRCPSGSAPSPDFLLVLNSIPIDNITDEVTRNLSEPGTEVQL